MTSAIRIALVLLAGHLAALAVAAYRVYSGPAELAAKVLVGVYAVFVAGASVALVLRRSRLGLPTQETPTLALTPADEQATGELARWVDTTAVEEMAARIGRLGAERDKYAATLSQISKALQGGPAGPPAVGPWIFEAPEDDPAQEPASASEAMTSEESPEPAAKPDAMVLLQLDPVRAEGARSMEPDRVVFGSRGRLTSRARVMLQKLGNRLRRDTGAGQD